VSVGRHNPCILRGALLALTILLVPPGLAQQRRPDGPQEPPAREPQSRPFRPNRDGLGQPPRRPLDRPLRPGERHSRMDRFAEINPFRPEPEDFGPLAPGEDEALLEFAQEYIPRVFRMLQELKRASPERYRFRLAQTAPRLRQLRRVAATNVELARRLVHHAEQIEQIRQAVRRMVQAGGDDPQMHERGLDIVRRRTRDLLTIEARVLNDRATELEQERETRIQKLIDELLADDADLSAEPPPLQAMIRQIRAAGGEESAPQLERLRARLRQRFDESIERLRSRVAEIRADLEGEVERRAEEFIHGRGLPPP